MSIKELISNHWYGSLKTEEEKKDFQSKEFAKPCRPTLTNTLCGDTQLGHDLYFQLSSKMPYSFQAVRYSMTAAILGSVAIPAIFAKAMKHLVFPGKEGCKALLLKDAVHLTKAVKSIVLGVALTILRIPTLALDPFRFMKWSYDAALFKFRYEKTPDGQENFSYWGPAALVGVDVQKGFTPRPKVESESDSDSDEEGCSELPVADGYAELPVLAYQSDMFRDPKPDKTWEANGNIDRLIKVAKSTTLRVATLDWHPKGHVSFAAVHGKDPWTKTWANGQREQMLFPEHCIEGTKGAEFAGLLEEADFDLIVKKGNHLLDDSYSGFGGNTKAADGISSLYWTEMEAQLKARKIETVFIGGLATDVCVKATAEGALRAGFNVILIQDATAGVEETAASKDGILKELRTIAKEPTVDRVFDVRTTKEMLAMRPYFVESEPS